MRDRAGEYGALVDAAEEEYDRVMRCDPSDLSSKGTSKNVMGQIERDIGRTFPTHYLPQLDGQNDDSSSEEEPLSQSKIAGRKDRKTAKRIGKKIEDRHAKQPINHVVKKDLTPE